MMRMLFKGHRSEKVGLFQSILESEGIPTVIKSEFITATQGTWAADPEVPELWVLDDESYDRAIDVLRLYAEPPSSSSPEPPSAAAKPDGES